MNAINDLLKLFSFKAVLTRRAGISVTTLALFVDE